MRDNRYINEENIFDTDIEVENDMHVNFLDHMYAKEKDKQFIIDILISEDNKRWKAFCMGKHHRLGEKSSIKILPNDVFKIIRKFHNRDVENMIDDETIEDILMIIEQTECSVQTAIKVYLKTNRNMVEAIIMLYTWWF